MMIMGDRKKMLASILGPDRKAGTHEGSEGEEAPDELEVLSQELIEAVHARNPGAVAQALRAAFECMDSEPHVEGPNESEE